MKMRWMVLTVIPALFFLCMRADAKKTDSKTGYQTANVVSVQKHAADSNYAGTSGSDAPLMADDYSYDIGIRLNCDVYVARYQSATDYLPSVFAPNHPVDVRLQKHILFVSLPDTDREVKMGIIHQNHVAGDSCSANS